MYFSIFDTYNTSKEERRRRHLTVVLLAIVVSWALWCVVSIPYYKDFSGPRLTPSMLKDMSADILQRKVNYRKRLLLEQGTRTLVTPVEEVSHIAADTGGTKAFLKDGTYGYVGVSLSQLEGELNPEHFTRVNRQFIVALDAIEAFDDLPAKRECALVLKKPYDKAEIHITIPKRKELTGLLY